MSTHDDNERSTLSTNTLIPVSSDKTPLAWDGNDATILGLLHETGRHYKNKGLFQPLLRDRAVALSNGRLAVEDPNTVYFVSGTIVETRSFDDPCPPTIDRITEHNDEVGLGTRAGTEQALLDAVPDDHRHSIIIAKHCVEKEDSSFLHSLSYVFGNAEPSEQLLEESDGSGLEFLRLLRVRGNSANSRDKALVATKFSSLINGGVRGELTLDSFSAFLKLYKAARRNIPPLSRPPAVAEAEMISIIAIKDPASRELYELKAEAKPPATLEAAAEILINMLRGRVRCEEIDQLAAGATDLSSRALAATKTDLPAVKPPSGLGAALAAVGIDASMLKPEQLSALVSALAPADPRKTGAGKLEVHVPRGADGKPNKWVEGMAICRCGLQGGKHLFKDCPKTKEKAKKALAAAALASKAAACAAPAAFEPTEAMLRTALAAFFNSAIEGAPSEASEDK